MRVLVCGGRDYAGERALFDALDLIHEQSRITTIINGGAPGADLLSSKWALRRAVPCWVFPADWDSYGKAAGPIRNALMVEEAKPNLVLAFPGGKGTANMVAVARAAQVKVREFNPST